MEMQECNNCGAKVLFLATSFRIGFRCTQCLRETVKGLEAELKQSNELFEVMPAGKDRNMVDGRIELITAHIKFRQELDDEISKATLEAESEMAEIQKLKNIRKIAKEDAELTKSQLEATEVRLNLLKQSEPVDEGQLLRVLSESVHLSKKEAGAAIDARESERDLVLGEATYKKDNEIRRLAIDKLSFGDVHIAKIEHSFNERYVYSFFTDNMVLQRDITPGQLRYECKSLEERFIEFQAAFDAEKDAHKKQIPEIEATYRNWMDAKEAELARLGDELEKLEAPDSADREEMEIKHIKIAVEVEERKVLVDWETISSKYMFDQKELEQEQYRLEWLESCEVLKNLEEKQVIGEYEWKIDGDTYKEVFLESGVNESYVNGKKREEPNLEVKARKWKISNGEIHVKYYPHGDIFIYRINANKSITGIAVLPDGKPLMLGGKREDIPKRHQSTYKKIK